MNKGITYDDVAATAEAFKKSGETPSIKKIRDRIGGSPNTIQRHLATWRERQKEEIASIEIPHAITDAVRAEIARAAAEARIEADQQLLALEDDNRRLAQEATEIQTENHELKQQVAALKIERDTAVLKAQHQELELEQLSARIEDAHAEAQLARMELTEERTRAEGRQALIAEHGLEIERLGSALKEESIECIAAQQTVAVLNARLEGAAEQASKMERSIASLEEQLSASNTHWRHAASELTVVMRAHQEAIQDLHRKDKEAQHARDAAKRAEREAAELRGRLDSLGERPPTGSL